MGDLFLIKIFEKVNKERKQKWSHIFEKYSKPFTDDVNYSFADAPRVLNEESEEMDELELVYFIENVLQSNLRELYLGREKAKIFNDTKYFKKASEVIETEFRKLLKHVDIDAIVAYIKFTTQVDPSTFKVIEDVKENNLKELLLNYAEAKNSADESCITACKEKLLQEWKALCKVLDEGEIVVYALHLKRQYSAELN